jgi:hypothetical protein
MEIRTQITKDDLVGFRLFHALRSGSARIRFLFWAIVPPLAASVIPLWLTRGHLNGLVRLSFLFVVPVYAFLFYLQTRAGLARKLEVTGNTQTGDLGEHSILLAEEGIHIAHEAETKFFAWTDIVQVIVNTNYGYIYTSADQAVIIPLRCFADENQFALFMKMAVIYHCNTQRASTARVGVDCAASGQGRATNVPLVANPTPIAMTSR